MAPAEFFAAGGRFVLFEEHPMAMCLSEEEGRVAIVEDYFDTGRPAEYEGGWAHFEGARSRSSTSSDGRSVR